jgi:hypothetical protein
VDARQTLVLAIRRRRIALAGHDGSHDYANLPQIKCALAMTTVARLP